MGAIAAMRKFRLLVVEDEHARDEGGALVFDGEFHRFVPYFAEYCESVRVCIPVVGARRGQRYWLCEKQIEVIPTAPYYSSIGYLKSALRILYRNVRTFVSEFRKSDIVLFRVPSPNIFAAALIARWLKVPTALLVAGPAGEVAKLNPRYATRFMRFVRWSAEVGEQKAERWLAARSAVFVTDPELMNSMARLGIRAELSIPSLLSAEDFCEPPREDTCASDSLELLFVGRLSPEKGASFLIEAAAHVKSIGKQLRITIVGDGPLRKDLEQKASKIGMEHGVSMEFLGRIRDSSHLNTLRRRADIFVLPSLADNIPRVIVEAMANCLPIVATRVGGIPFVVRDGETGVLVDAGSPEALAGGIRKLVLDSGLRKRFIANGYAFARKHTAASRAKTMYESMEAYLREPARARRQGSEAVSR